MYILSTHLLQAGALARGESTGNDLPCTSYHTISEPSRETPAYDGKQMTLHKDESGKNIGRQRLVGLTIHPQSRL